MNRRWRRLLTGGLIGAAVSMLMGRGRKRTALSMEKRLRRQVGPMVRSFLGAFAKEGLGQKLFFLRRRVK
ncbi:MAG TPA: hypothetical protein GXZ98_03680 [Firmicutes bacterium]|jgi:hypothetical protein|nr:hypothetical protein [Bacillota bacterium]